jgi:hypothetical protein
LLDFFYQTVIDGITEDGGGGGETGGIISDGVNTITIQTPQKTLKNFPQSINYLQQPAYNFNIQRLPYVSYYCQRVNLPGISVGSVDFPTKGLRRIPVSGDIVFNNLEIEFFVDEDLQNWLEVMNWLRSIANAEDFTEYTGLQNSYSNATLIVLNSAMNAKYKVEYRDIIPISLTDINFDTTVSEITPITATVTFEYTTHTITRL